MDKLPDIEMIRHFARILENVPLGYQTEHDHARLDDFVRRCKKAFLKTPINFDRVKF